MFTNRRVVPFPGGAQDHLHDKWGFPRYSLHHLNRLVKEGKFPRPIKVSDRRRVSIVDELDAHAEAKIAQAQESGE
jgi:hypothetical protein